MYTPSEHQLSEYQGYTGIDADIETSLFEYGLIWVKGIEGHEKDYHFIYGVSVDEEGNYNLFDWGDIAIDTDPRQEWNFVDWDSVLSLIGVPNFETMINEIPLPIIVYYLIGYYGSENIMGSSYYPFRIIQGEE